MILGALFFFLISGAIMTTTLQDLASALQCTLFPVHVLVVDDDASTRTSMQRVLERQGYQVMTASDAFEALRVLEETHVAVDLVVTDVQMPGMQGDALVGRIRRASPELPVLFVSGEPGYAELPDRSGGRSRFLLKPFGPDELLDSVRAVLG